MKIIDISKELFSTPVYEDDPAPQLKFVKDMKKGFEYNLSEIRLCPHNATHVDAPLHFINGGEDVLSIPLEKCIGSCLVVEERFISLTDAEKLCRKSKRLLFRGKVDISVPAASVFARKLDLIATEQNSIGNAAVHKALLKGGVVILENVDLSNASNGEYLIFSPPLKMQGAEGSVCRACLIDMK